jgi:hypothetical protein
MNVGDAQGLNAGFSLSQENRQNPRQQPILHFADAREARASRGRRAALI